MLPLFTISNRPQCYPHYARGLDAMADFSPPPFQMRPWRRRPPHGRKPCRNGNCARQPMPRTCRSQAGEGRDCNHCDANQAGGRRPAERGGFRPRDQDHEGSKEDWELVGVGAQVLARAGTGLGPAPRSSAVSKWPSDTASDGLGHTTPIAEPGVGQFLRLEFPPPSS